MNRRQILKSLSAIAIAGIAPSLARTQPLSNFGLPTLPKERFRRFRLGENTEIIALHDGATRLPLHERYVTNAPFDEVKALATKIGLSTDYVELTFTGFLVVTGSRRILLDTGLGEVGSPPETTGHLLNSMRMAGFRPEEIDTVVITHFHADHISGLRSKAGEFIYPNAKVWVSSREYDYWMSDDNMKATPERKTAFELARRVFSGMPQSMLQKYTPGQEVAPGVFSKPAYGHTPGHTIYEIKDGSQSFNYIGDMVNVPAYFLRHPEWIVASDMDRSTALALRQQTLSGIADSGALIGGFHFPFPAIGHLRPEGAGYLFEPLP